MNYRLHRTRTIGAAVVVGMLAAGPSVIAPVGAETHTAPSSEVSRDGNSPGAQPGHVTSEPHPRLVMVLIRAPASALPRLREMPLDIVRIRPVDTDRTPTTKDDFLNTKFELEAVVPVSLLAKLRTLSLEIVEVP